MVYPINQNIPTLQRRCHHPFAQILQIMFRYLTLPEDRITVLLIHKLYRFYRMDLSLLQ